MTLALRHGGAVARATSNRRLLKLAAFLEALPDERFYYGSLVGETWQGAPDLSCGTTACALGWAAAMPEFRRLGLRLLPGEGGDLRFGTVGLKQSGVNEYRAAAIVFGIDYYEAWFLFEPFSSPGRLGFEWRAPGYDAAPKEVADHIRRFVKHRNPDGRGAAGSGQ